MLAYLVVTWEMYSREALATLLWPEDEPSRGRARLRREPAVLNQLSGQGYLEAHREQLGLVRSKGQQVWLDVSAFRELLAECRGHGHPANQVGADCLLRLNEVVALYRRDFLAGFGVKLQGSSPGWVRLYSNR